MPTQELGNRWKRNDDDEESPEKRRAAAKRSRTMLALAASVAALAAVPALAGDHYDRGNPDHQVIVRAARADVGAIAAQYGLEVAGELENAEGEYAALLQASSLDADQLVDLVASDPRAAEVSRVELASLPDTSNVVPAMEDLLGDLSKPGDFTTPCLSEGFSGLLWSGFADQEAVREIRLHEAHAANGDCGTAVVAVIDTGVDPDHPLLREGLVEGYDFILESAGVPSEWTNLDQSIAAIVEQSIAAIVEQSNQAVYDGTAGARLDQSIAAIVEQSIAAIVEQDIPPYFGHGTMVSGLVRLAAPAAWIMPLKVFDGSGRAHLFDVVRAIYYAVDHGADVINMSFSVEEDSTELMRAIQYARKHGVVCVAAAGNQGDNAMIYPAAYPGVISVASLHGEDLTPFSNFGTNLVDVAAPGAGVVSAYPGGLYGAGWGTSFSSPLVAGAMALLVHYYPQRSTATRQEMENALRLGSDRIDELINLIGSGRLDVLGTVLEVRE